MKALLGVLIIIFMIGVLIILFTLGVASAEEKGIWIEVKEKPICFVKVKQKDGSLKTYYVNKNRKEVKKDVLDRK